MIAHKDLGNSRFERTRALLIRIRKGEVSFGGNKNLKIYGRLDCKAGKRMKVENRVFFLNATEAINLGYRPCAICMRKEYLLWKEAQAGMFPHNTVR